MKQYHLADRRSSSHRLPEKLLVFRWGWVWLSMVCGPVHGLTLSGITEPVRDATLSVTVRGIVQKIHVDEGDEVGAEEILLELDSILETWEAKRRKLVWESKIEVESAAQTLAIISKDVEATRQLFQATGSVSAEELDKKELEYALAQAELERLRLAEQREEIEYRMAQEQVRQRIIKAPFAGTITDILVEVGESCDPKESLLRLVDRSQLHFVGNVDAEAAHGLQVGQPVRLQVGGGGQPISLRGRMIYVSPVVDAASGLQEVKALFENAGGVIRPGVAGVLMVGQDGAEVIRENHE